MGGGTRQTRLASSMKSNLFLSLMGKILFALILLDLRLWVLELTALMFLMEQFFLKIEKKSQHTAV